MTDTATTATDASGHFGGAGLDLPSLNLMLEALTDFVDAALSPDLQLELDHEDRCPEDIVRAMSDPMTLGVQLVFIPEQYGGMDGGRVRLLPGLRGDGPQGHRPRDGRVRDVPRLATRSSSGRPRSRSSSGSVPSPSRASSSPTAPPSRMPAPTSAR